MKKRSLYLECYSGISGDMTVGALLDLGADREKLDKTLHRLHIGGFDVRITRVMKSGLDVCDFDVVLDHDNHDHDNEYLYGEKSRHHDHDCQTHHHEHRGLREILSIIDEANMSDRAKDIARKTFTTLAEAEAEAHGVRMEDVHFHEVGAVDSIVDIISAAVCFDDLGIDEVIVPEVYDGKGTVRCQHGVIPVPVPAVSNIASQHGLKLHIMDAEGEYVTPTGAALAVALRTSSELPKRFSIDRIGMGAGKRKTERTGILRAMIITTDDHPGKDTICKLECNVDDCSGETLGFAMERLMGAGARDVHYSPVFMKKNRPAYQLNVICGQEDVQKMEQIIFEETTTIGIRHILMERTVLQREIVKVQTPFGDVDVKICGCGTDKHYYPEYESVTEICRKKGIPYQTAYRMIQSICLEMSNREESVDREE